MKRSSEYDTLIFPLICRNCLRIYEEGVEGDFCSETCAEEYYDLRDAEINYEQQQWNKPKEEK